MAVTRRATAERAPAERAPAERAGTRRAAEPPAPGRRAHRLGVDPIRCSAHGLCAELLPERVVLDDWGYPIVDGQPVDDRPRGPARRAVAACPTLALKLVPLPTPTPPPAPAPGAAPVAALTPAPVLPPDRRAEPAGGGGSGSLR
jgi:ferredoxin